MNEMPNIQKNNFADNEMGGISTSERLQFLREHLKLLTVAPLTAGLPALDNVAPKAPTFPAVTTLVPPQQSQGGAASVLPSLGMLAGLDGGPTKGADDASIFLIRANGAVSSSLEENGIFKRGNQLSDLRADRGDPSFVSEESNKTTWVHSANDWTQILYQLGIGSAGIKSAVQ